MDARARLKHCRRLQNLGRQRVLPLFPTTRSLDYRFLPPCCRALTFCSSHSGSYDRQDQVFRFRDERLHRTFALDPFSPPITDLSSQTRTSATPSNTAAASSSSSGSTSNTSTIVGVVCAIAGVAALIALFFGVRKYRAKKAARSGGAGFTKHDEDDDVFGNSHADPNNGGGEKFARTQSYGAIGGNSPGLMAGAGAGVGAAAGMAGFGAGRQQQQQQEYQHQQQQHQQFHPQQQQDSRGWDSPSLPSTPSSYPPPSSASSLALLQDQQHRSSRYEDSPYGAGAAGGGALARIEETNGMSLPGMPTPSPFVEVASQGKIHIVKRTFEPTLGDELVIFVRAPFSF